MVLKSAGLRWGCFGLPQGTHKWASNTCSRNGEGLLPFWYKEIPFRSCCCPPVSHMLMQEHCCADFSGAKQLASYFMPCQPASLWLRHLLNWAKPWFLPAGSLTAAILQNWDDWFFSVSLVSLLLNTGIPILMHISERYLGAEHVSFSYQTSNGFAESTRQAASQLKLDAYCVRQQVPSPR